MHSYPPSTPIDDFCSSDQRFAIHCFQLSRHRDHLVDLLSLPISGRLRDLHPIDNAHAEHTQLPMAEARGFGHNLVNCFYLFFSCHNSV